MATIVSAAPSRWSGKRQSVFKSVFDSEISQPTPCSIPSQRFKPQGEPFGGALSPPLHHQSSSRSHFPSHGKPAEFHVSSSSRPSQTSASMQVSDQVRWNQAWHIVTARIQLPPSVAAEDSFGTLAPESQDYDADFYDSLKLVLHPAKHAEKAASTEDILSWHTQQVRHHFAQHVLPLLSACNTYGDQSQVLLGSIHTLEAAHRQYLYGLSLIVRGLENKHADIAVDKFRRDLHAVIGNSMSQALMESLRAVLSRLMRLVLGMQQTSPLPSSPRTANLEADRQAAAAATARQELLQLIEALHKVGLAGESFQVLFAELMDAMMVEHIRTSFAGAWTQSKSDGGKDAPRASSVPRATKLGTPSRCIAALCNWVENHYSRLAVEVFARLGSGDIAWTDVEKWKEIAVGRLAVMRIHELFDIVLQWPHSRDALDDLRMAITTPQRRLQLTDTFSAALQKRLLHPGRSTLDILRVYISMIRTFHALDHSKVLLDRVVHSLQLYLCQRDDAIPIVVTGLLSNPDDSSTEAGSAKLIELAILLNDPSQQRRPALEDEELDWDDMEWIPDPVDAGVNYKRPKSEDVIGTLISALGSQDIFIKEFQNIIAERLLSTQVEFSQEVRVLNLLKKRFGDNALQNCDVMIKDIQDSKKVDAIISKTVRTGVVGSVRKAHNTPSYHTKILSRLFWPTMDREHFILPRPVVEGQGQYEGEFERLKSNRKLTWLNNLGNATVSLELEDRTVEKECKTYEAVVIYAFQTDESYSGPLPVRRTVDELEEVLQMDDDLIRSALSFWVGQRVIREIEPGTFIVIEKLDDDADDGGNPPGPGPDDAPAPDSGDLSPKKPGALDAKEKERRQVYWQFIVGMLTNSSPAMPLVQIAMMMKMLIADGFPWSNEELQEFLAEKMAMDELELVGGKYRLPKK
ncbi:Cullin family protein [Colletotrichum scovillei]|uniref:Anaphase-promoting complex subunit 2 n=1 Tax=Colletotrichum scovillei TaxID=1209932 RepID=A0A9P7QUY1_9PEZI|nr:Cullin family protein [Colletotrichum scovillei]KAF4775224.1 Cullin family protein [Colletotrichum scovillei]KAG7043037.1 anaphase-promoting complex subunit 2 [Colletotrichum scovillei]KAG7043622.1 anaphase-promoting complex subunit 2 [Colletotrichum scovillei]KAG7063074.1 anaphase-promoting complex subunit 2 [Colletotrichum scovillei]